MRTLPLVQVPTGDFLRHVSSVHASAVDVTQVELEV